MPQSKVTQYRHVRMSHMPQYNPTGRKNYVNSPEPSLTSIDRWVGSESMTRQDHWNWPYPVAVNRYTFFNAWDGNQMPGFEKNSLETYGFTWIIPMTQQSQENQRGGSISSTGMSKNETSSLLKGIQAAWRNTDS